MAYDDQPRVPEDLVPGAVMLTSGVVLLVAMLIAGATGLISSCSSQELEPEAGATPLVVETGNAASMHAYGLPTKADVMEWHLHGQWSYRQDGELFVLDKLPGRTQAWDALYGIDPDNPAFGGQEAS